MIPYVLHQSFKSMDYLKGRCSSKFLSFIFRLEKEKHCLQSEVIQVQQSADKTLSEKELAEKDRKQTLLSLNDTKLQLDGALRNLKDANISHQKLSDEKKKLILESDEKDLLVSQLKQQQFNLKKQLSSALQQMKDVTLVGNNLLM